MDQINTTAAPALAADPNAAEEYERPKVHYVCGGKYKHPSIDFITHSCVVIDCGKDNTPDKDQMIRCIYCGYRIFYKKRDRALLQYEAR